MADFIEDIRVTDYTTTSRNGYTPIHVKVWKPNGDPTGVIQIAHGMSEYIERYDRFARYMASKGFLVVGNDMMGNGQSVESEDDLGYFSIPIKGLKGAMKNATTSSAYVVRDLHYITKVVKKHYPGIPYVLYGHSMGSFMARRYLMEFGKELDGLILTGSGRIPYNRAMAIYGMVHSLIKTRGDRHIPVGIGKVMYKSFNRGIKNPSSPNSWISSMEDRVKEYDEDPKCGFPYTLNGYEALAETLVFIEDKNNLERMPKDAKIYIMNGSEDPLGNFGEGVKELLEEFQSYGIDNCSMVLYEGCRHEIINDTCEEKVYQDMHDWIIENVM